MATNTPGDRTRGAPPKLTKGRVKEALEKTGGVFAMAASALGVNRSTIGRFIDQKHPELRIFAAEQRAEITDIAEGHMMLAVKKGDAAACKYWLDNFGQDRGFGVRKLAFRDGQGQMVVPAVLVTPGKMTPEEWDKQFAHLGDAPSAE